MTQMKPTQVSPIEAVAWASTFALHEAVLSGAITKDNADHVVDRMNTLIGHIFDGQVVGLNTETGLFEPKGKPKEDPVETDVLVIKGASA